MQTTTLNGELFARMVESGAARLFAYRSVVNDLNVFPIPDGDTGDNMYMTMDSGAANASEAEGEALGVIAGRIAKGMLLGARGNSGVILSRIFAGIAKGLEGVGAADIGTFASAMQNGVTESYNAVRKPVEGTILTVFGDAVRKANSEAGDETSFESYFDVFMDELRASLERTPELLNVLREAGVVDSGGAGIVYIAEGMREALLGAEAGPRTGAASAAHRVDTSALTEDSPFDYGYCTEFLLRLRTEKVGPVGGFDEKPLIDWLMENGESVVAFREGSIIKAHVHTMTPEAVLAHCHEYGEFLTLKIENMMLQHNETNIRNNYVPPKRAKKRFGIVAVAAGEGIRNTFLELGADAVVDGGQSMNPSAESFLKAFDEVNAEHILVFPNNGNIILTARQAAELTNDADVRVLPSRSIGECYAALSLLDISSGDPDEIERGCAEVMASVKTGAVSVASRTTERDGVSIREGDYIGFSEGVVRSDAPDPESAALALADSLSADEFGILMLVCGKDAGTNEARALADSLQKAHPRVEVILLDGGQPIYDYIMILE
ncbi:MAG: DAK2 domain-containing protein [Clostridia bacterium]|nr:DAK2 domain-containing protein [Clostridia bacterium]